MDKKLALGMGSLIIVCILAFTTIGGKQQQNSAMAASSTPEANVLLTDANSIIFREEVSEESITALQLKILERANKLNGSPLYLVLDTPGGSIPAGNDLIDFIRGLNIDVRTITQFSASMGAYISQALGERLVTNHGTYMFHRAKVGGVGGEIPGEFLVRSKMLLDLVTSMEKDNAARMGLSFEGYSNLTRDEYYVSGAEAVKAGVADKVINISCAEDLKGTYTKNVQVMMFSLEVTYSKCPAIRGPISVKMAGGGEPDSQGAQSAIDQFLNRAGIQRYTELQ